jgi:hypothetical protein
MHGPVGVCHQTFPAPGVYDDDTTDVAINVWQFTIPEKVDVGAFTVTDAAFTVTVLIDVTVIPDESIVIDDPPECVTVIDGPASCITIE